MNENSDFIGVNESNADSHNSPTTVSQLVAFLSNYECKCHSMTVLVEDQILSINENDESIYNLSFEAKSRNGLKVTIATKFIDKDYDNLRESIPLIRFKGANKYRKNYVQQFPGTSINYMTVKQLQIIYQQFEECISLFTIPEKDLLVIIPITMPDGKQIDITFKKISENKYVVTEIDI